MKEDQVNFVDECLVREKVQAAFSHYRELLLKLLPGADVQHVGSTAVPNSITKGDLDIQVRVTAAQFAQAEEILAAHFARNESSTRTSSFASFKNDFVLPPLGIQLTVIGSELDDF